MIGSLAKIYVKTGEDEVACGVEAKNSDGKINVGGQHDKSKCARMIKRKHIFQVARKTMFATKSTK